MLLSFGYVFMLLFVVKQCHCFNVAIDGSSEKILRHERQTYVSRTAYYNRQTNAKPFFGNALVIGKGVFDGTPIIETIIGAPTEHVMSDTSIEEPPEGGAEVRPASLKSIPAMGTVYSCGLLNKQFISNSSHVTDCNRQVGVTRSLTGYEIGDRDALGVTVTASKISPDLSPFQSTMQKRIVSCAHLRMHNCGNVRKAEGSCYISKTVPGRGDGRFSREWRKVTPCREDCSASNIDLMFLIDGSASIKKRRFEKVKEWVIQVASGFDLKNQVRAGVVQYSHWYQYRSDDNQRYLKTEVALGQYNNTQDFDKAVRAIEYQGYTTYTAHAMLKTIRDDFNSAKSRYPKAQRILILLTDGNSTDVGLLPTAIAVANDAQVTSFAVGVEGYVLKELEMIAGSRDRVFTVANFNQLAGIASSISQGIQNMEGGSNDPSVTNKLMQCQAGISADISHVSWKQCMSTIG